MEGGDGAPGTAGVAEQGDGPAPPESGLALQLEKNAKKRTYVIQEVISTEFTYIERLKLAIDSIITPLKTQKLLDAADVSEQFSLLEKIYELHIRNSVDGSSSQNLKFVDLFNDMAANFDIYTEYLVNYEPAMQRRGHLLTRNRRFADFIAKVEKDPTVNMTLESILIMPVQRIPRYRLLLEQLLKYTPESHGDFPAVQNALGKICDLASFNNEAIRARENRNKIMNVVMQLDPAYRIDLMDDKHRRHVREGALLKQCRKRSKDFQFWLFSDALLYGEKTPLGTYTLNRQLHLSKLKVTAPRDSDPDSALAFIIESPAKSFKVIARSEEEKREWVAAIADAVEKQRSNLGSDTQVAPLWMPDNNSTQCELCSAAFTLLFRRHHCRHCGRLVCVNCSTHRFLLQHLHATVPVRVCDPCFKKLSAEREGEKDVVSVASERTADAAADDDDSDLDERDSGVSEGELDDFNEFMKDVEAGKDVPVDAVGADRAPSPSKPAEVTRGLRIPLLFGTRSSSAASSPHKESPLWPFRRASLGGSAPPPEPEAPPVDVSPAATSRTKTLADDVMRSLSAIKLSGAQGSGAQPPPKPPRRGSLTPTSSSPAPASVVPALAPSPPQPAATPATTADGAAVVMESPCARSRKLSRRGNLFVPMPVPEEEAAPPAERA